MKLIVPNKAVKLPGPGLLEPFSRKSTPKLSEAAFSTVFFALTSDQKQLVTTGGCRLGSRGGPCKTW